MTNFERLSSTLRHADKFWLIEQHCQKKNAVNEDAWSGQVVQQVPAALGKLDTTMSRFQCFFYRNSDTKKASTGTWDFEGSDLTDADLDAFLDTLVMPRIERWRQEATTTGIPA